MRYVGKTVKRISKRLSDHVQSAQRGSKTHRDRWIRGILNDGLAPSLFVIETIPAGDNWEDAEKHFISYFRSIGCRLTNLTSGGEGMAGHTFTEDHRAKIGLAHRGKIVSVETRAKQSERKGNSSSQYIGVSFHKKMRKWRVTIRLNGKQLNIGHFLDEEDAARAYDKVAAEAFGIDNYIPNLPAKAS